MSSRNPTIDHLKAVACLLIVCHHLAFYGPMCDVLRTVWPGLIDWFNTYARMAVQVFLVLGGYLAAATLTPKAQRADQPFWPVVSQRFVRLSLPYSAALVLAIVVNETVRSQGFDHPSVSATPTWDSLLAHLLLLHSIGDWESISAGVWYVAIDMQLYALCWAWLWLCSRSRARRKWGPIGIAIATAASLLLWNLDSQLDMWAVYFIGAYGLGMMAWWATHSATAGQRQIWVTLIIVLSGAALALAWRDRIALAAVCALALAIGAAQPWPAAWGRRSLAPLVWIGQRSYSIFLVHFPISLLVNAEVYRSWPNSVTASAMGVGIAIAMSITSGAVLYEWTEKTPVSWQRLRQWYVGVASTSCIAMLCQWF